MMRSTLTFPERTATVLCGALLVLVSAVGCNSDALLGPDAAQGIDGIVLRGPTCPVQSLDDPCPDQPYAARIDVLEEGGGRVTTVRTGEDGRFRVGLRPGRYGLVPENGDPFPFAQPEEVLVEEGTWTEVVILYDTGIR